MINNEILRKITQSISVHEENENNVYFSYFYDCTTLNKSNKFKEK